MLDFTLRKKLFFYLYSYYYNKHNYFIGAMSVNQMIQQFKRTYIIGQF